jgi:hypothetical protein
MKKMFKLLLCAAIIAAGFTACSEEVTPIDPNNPSGTDGTAATGESTYASFSFSVPGGNTKSLTTLTENTTIDNYRVMIFDNSTGKLEVDTVKLMGTTNPATDTLLTIILMSGSKRIYVYANGGYTAGPPPTSPTYVDIPAKGAGTFNYTYGTVSQINSIYTLGSSTTGTAVQTDLTNMHSLYTGGKFFYSNPVNENVYNLQPGVTANESQTQGNTNRLYIEIDRPVAKLGVRQTAGATSIETLDGKGNITPASIQYKVWNVNTQMYPFQNYDGAGTLITPEYIPSATNTEALYWYAREQGKASNAFIEVPNGAVPASSYYYYVSENSPSTKMKGNTTFANVEAIYLPKASYYVSTAIAYNENAGGSWTPTPATQDLPAPGTDMYLLLTGYTGLPVKTLFAGGSALTLAKKVFYHINGHQNEAEHTPLTWYDTAVNLSAAGVQDAFDNLFAKYTDGKAYYRLNIGKPTGTSIDYIVRRNWWYDCNITGFLELGAHTPAALNEPEDEVLAGITNLAVTIVIRDWSGATINTNI